MSRSRGRHRYRPPAGTGNAVTLPAVIALAGALVTTVPGTAFGEQVPVGGAPPVRACGSASAAPPASASASPSGAQDGTDAPSASASPSQAPTTATASAGASSPDAAQPDAQGAAYSVAAPGPCLVKVPSSPSTAPSRSSPPPTTPSRRPSSPGGSTAATSPAGSAPGSAPSGAPSGFEGLQPPGGAQEPYGPITRAEIMQRALAWVEERVPYSQTAWWVDQEGSYRQDCSGYVSMAWGLDQAIDFWTGNLGTVSYPILPAQLLPGDILLSTTHTVLFAGWADGAHTVFDFYEESHPGTVAHYVTGATLADFLNAGFVPYRYDGITGPTAGPFVTPTEGIPITALGPLAQELAPQGTDVQEPAPGSWQTAPTPTRSAAAAVRDADLERAAATVPDREAGSVGVAVGGSLLLFTGLSLALTRRRAERAAAGRPRRRH